MTKLAVILVFVGVIGLVSEPVNAQTGTVPACSIDSPPANCAGMWALGVQTTAPNGAYVHVPDPGCLNDAAGEISKVVQAAVAVAVPQLAAFSGPISQLVATPLNDALKSQGGDLGRLFSPYAKNGALCAPVVAVIPVDAKVAGYRYFASEAGGPFARCSPGTDCPIGWSKFQADPVEAGSGQIRTYSAVFMNWSHDRTRVAKMLIFYTLPAGKTPITQI